MRVRNVEVGKLIGESPHFRIYLGAKDNQKQVILKVAKTFDDNDQLAREAGKFNVLSTFGDEIAKIESDQGKKSSRYDWLFARLQASFMEASQGDRRISIFEMPNVDLAQLVPVSKLRGNTEIDARTSVWILGRFFKFYSLFELIAASGDDAVARYPKFSPDDYLIGPERHRLIYYNFSEEIADVFATDFVRSIASFVLNWVAIEDDSNEQKYFELLKDFAENGRNSFEDAHRDLYQLVGELWGFHYHPFTYRERKTCIWNTIKEG